MPERFERQFFEQKEIPPEEKEEFEISKEKLEEPSEYWEGNQENEIRNLKEEFGETIEDLGLSEEILQQAEENLRETAESLENSEKKLQQKRGERIKSFCKDFFRVIVERVREILTVREEVTEEEKTQWEKIEYLKESWGSYEKLAEALFDQSSWVYLYETVRNKHLESFRSAEDREKFTELMLKEAWETQLQDFYLPKGEIEAEKEKGLEMVVGFEKMEMKNEFIKELIENTFPKSWIGSNLSSIEYQNKRETSDYMGAVTEIAGYALDEGGKSKGRVVLFEASKKVSPLEFLHLLAHEIAHTVDWYRANHLSFEERVDLLYAITQRIEAGDRYRSCYVENIRHEDKFIEMYRKCTEYWAEIVAEFLTDPWSESLPQKDADLVYSFIKKHDPDFDPYKAAILREEMMSEMRREMRRRVYRRAYEKYIKYIEEFMKKIQKKS